MHGWMYVSMCTVLYFNLLVNATIKHAAMACMYVCMYVCVNGWMYVWASELIGTAYDVANYYVNNFDSIQESFVVLFELLVKLHY